MPLAALSPGSHTRFTHRNSIESPRETACILLCANFVGSLKAARQVATQNNTQKCTNPQHISHACAYNDEWEDLSDIISARCHHLRPGIRLNIVLYDMNINSESIVSSVVLKLSGLSGLSECTNGT